MIRFYALVAAACFAVGCADDADRPVAADRAPASGGVVPCPNAGYAPLPPGVDVGHDFFVRNDRMVGKDLTRRRVVLELRSGDAGMVAASIVQALVTQGARQVQGPDGEGGAVRYVLTKPGSGRIMVSANDDLGRRPSHPDSTGVILVEWPGGLAGTADAAGEPREGTDDGTDDAAGTGGVAGQR